MQNSCASGRLTKTCLQIPLKTLEVGGCSSFILFYPCRFGIAENEMDGEALGTLFTTVQGPDCLKDLIATCQKNCPLENSFLLSYPEMFCPPRHGSVSSAFSVLLTAIAWQMD